MSGPNDYGKGDTNRTRDFRKFSRGYDLIKWSHKNKKQKQKINEDVDKNGN